MIKNTIENLLNKLQISTLSKGYIYWIEAVQQQLKIHPKNIYIIYKSVAKKYHVNAISVEKAMRLVLSKNYKKIKTYFNINYRITNKILLILLVKEIEKVKKKGNKMERLEELGTIVDTLSMLIKEVNSDDLKGYLTEILDDFSEEKKEEEEEMQELNEEYEAGLRRDIDSIRL